jgi:hypothetical protein
MCDAEANSCATRKHIHVPRKHDIKIPCSNPNPNPHPHARHVLQLSATERASRPAKQSDQLQAHFKIKEESLKVKIVPSPFRAEDAVLHRTTGGGGVQPGKKLLLLPEDSSLSAVVEFEYFSSVPMSIQCLWGVDLRSFEQLTPAGSVACKNKPLCNSSSNAGENLFSKSSILWRLPTHKGRGKSSGGGQIHQTTKVDGEPPSSSDNYGIEMESLSQKASTTSNRSRLSFASVALDSLQWHISSMPVDLPTGAATSGAMFSSPPIALSSLSKIDLDQRLTPVHFPLVVIAKQSRSAVVGNMQQQFSSFRFERGEPDPISSPTGFPFALKAFAKDVVILTESEKWEVQELYDYKQDGPQNDCTVCLDQPRSVTLLPCRHCCVCIQCSTSILNCPVCRTVPEMCLIIDHEQKAYSLPLDSSPQHNDVVVVDQHRI